MKNNILISATDQYCQQFAVGMFKSFKKYNPGIRMYCIVRDIDLEIEDELILMGVEIIDYAEPDTFDIRNFSIIIAPYLSDIEYSKAMWMDIDALVFADIRHLFNCTEEFVAIPQNLGQYWRYIQDNGEPCFAMGTWVSTKPMVELMNGWYRDSDMKHSEGEFLKTKAGQINVRVLDGEEYSCCREMTESVQIESNRPYFVKRGKRLYPKFIHFSVTADGLRPLNYDKLEALV